MAKAYFTFCYNGVPKDTYPYPDEFTEVKLGEDEDDFINYNHKYAFVVDTKEPDVTFAELSRESLFRRLLGPVLFGWQDDEHLVISSTPDMATELINADIGTILRVKAADDGFYKLPTRELDRACISPIKYGVNCEGCPRHEPKAPGDCYIRQILKHTNALGWSTKKFLPPERVPADEFHPPELDEFLVKAVKNGYSLSNGYRYVRPRTAREGADLPSRDGKPGYLRYYNTLALSISTIEENKERFSQRACNAAATRRKQKRCRKECVFAPCDLFSKRGMTSWVDSCLEDAVSGPYTKERIAQIYRAWMKTFKTMRTPEEIAFIAYHAGRVTHVFGKELTLCGMDKNLENVRFVGYRANYDEYYSFEDALEILRTPWNRGGRDYARVYLCDEIPEMSEEALWAYAEICQRTESPGYTYWGGCMYMWAQPRIASIEWSGFDNFAVKTIPGWTRNPTGVEGVADLFEIRNTIRSHAKQQALQEEARQESSQDTQP